MIHGIYSRCLKLENYQLRQPSNLKKWKTRLKTVTIDSNHISNQTKSLWPISNSSFRVFQFQGITLHTILHTKDRPTEQVSRRLEWVIFLDGSFNHGWNFGIISGLPWGFIFWVMKSSHVIKKQPPPWWIHLELMQSKIISKVNLGQDGSITWVGKIP